MKYDNKTIYFSRKNILGVNDDNFIIKTKNKEMFIQNNKIIFTKQIILTLIKKEIDSNF